MKSPTRSLDPVRLEVFRHLFTALAEEMGAALRGAAYSPNIKERRDYSCAVFDGAGRVVAMGDHMPVHLGAMPMSVEAALSAFPNLGPGDVVILNDPFCGGTHLPDITLVAPVFVTVRTKTRAKRPATPLAFLSVRAHHADVGGIAAGSMPLAREIYQDVSLLSERRQRGPSGVRGGLAGEPGGNVLRTGSEDRVLPAKATFRVNAGAILSIRSPGGGGWGHPDQNDKRESE